MSSRTGFTGCNSISAFSGKGKLAALKLVKRNPEFQEVFQQLGMDWEVSDEVVRKASRIHMFVVLFKSWNK